MCGGLAFPAKKVAKGELEKWFSPGEIEEIGKTGVAQTFYWSKKPFLPVEDGENIRLVEWGNRDKELKLPQTGWAKSESINEGKWAWLNPKNVTIPVEKGCEKKQWFDVPSGGFRGIIVEKEGQEHAYMMTQAAEESYAKKYNHDRQPVEVS